MTANLAALKQEQTQVSIKDMKPKDAIAYLLKSKQGDTR